MVCFCSGLDKCQVLVVKLMNEFIVSDQING